MSNANEKFTIACPQCGEIVAVSRAHVGKKGRCGVCHNVFPITAPDNFVQRAIEPAPSLASTGPSLWDNAGPLAPAVAPVETSAEPAPRPSLADDYLQRARNDKGSAIEQEESDPTYRFVTSYGSVIGGIATIVFGLFMIFIFLLLLGSIRLTVVAVLVIGAGIGWLVQGMNYVTYYNWKDRGGRG